MVQISALSVLLLGGCHLIFPFEIDTRDDLGAVDANSDGPLRADAPVDVTDSALSGDSDTAIDATNDTAAPGDTVAPDDAPPKDTQPAKDSLVKADSTPTPACTPGCTGGDTCCDKGNGYQCYPSADQCLCDPATGKPCTGPHPVCCDRGVGKGYVCYGIAQACLCDPTTSEPCKQPYPYCCNKGFGYKCDDTCP